jgi:hypothetical protein
MIFSDESKKKASPSAGRKWPILGQRGRLRQQIYAIYAPFLLVAHRAFIMADNFLRMAALIGFRPAVFFWAGATFLGTA